MTPEELEYAHKQADYMRDLMLSGRSKDDALRAAWDERYALQKRAEAAEAALQAVMTRAAQADRQNEIYAAELDALAQRELRIRNERDEARRQLEQAVAAEREACATTAESARMIHGLYSGEIAYSRQTASDIAAAIRARSNKTK